MKRSMVDPLMLQQIKRLERALAAALDVGDHETAEAIHSEIAELWIPAEEDEV